MYCLRVALNHNRSDHSSKYNLYIVGICSFKRSCSLRIDGQKSRNKHISISSAILVLWPRLSAEISGTRCDWPHISFRNSLVNCIKRSCGWFIRRKLFIRKLFIISLQKKGKCRIYRTNGSQLFTASNVYLKLKIALLVRYF